MSSTPRSVRVAIMATTMVGAIALLASPSVAHTWNDPWFEDAIREASFIGLALVKADT